MKTVGSYRGRGLHGQVVETIGRRIMSGGLHPGDVLDTELLEQELGVSRTVLRESLKVLTAKGLVDSRQKRGTYVRPRADWNLLDSDILRWQFESPEASMAGTLFDDLAEIRTIVEPAVARLAAARHNDHDRYALETALDEMEQARGDAAAAAAADVRFHRALLGATHNELLSRMEVIIEAGLTARDRLVHGAEPADDPAPSHRAVLDAIVGGDPSGAEAAMHTLLDKATADLKHVQSGHS